MPKLGFFAPHYGKKRTNQEIMKYLLKFIKPHIGTVLLLMLLYALQSLCALFLPYVMSDIVESGIRNGDLHRIFVEGAIMVGLAAVALSCALVNNKVNSNFSARLSVELRKAVFNKVNSLSFEQFSALGTGSLITRTTDDVGWIEDTIAQVPYIIVTVPTFFIGGVALSFKGDWVLPLILLGVSLLVLVITTLISSRMEKYWQRGEEFTDVQNRVVRERLSGIRVVRAFDREQYEHGRVKKATSEMCNSFVTANTVSGLINPVASLLLNLAEVAILYVGAMRVQTESLLKAGDVLATIQYIALIANAILVLSWTISLIPHVKVSIKRVGEIMRIDSDRTYAESCRQIISDGSVTFDGVSFAYPGSSAHSLSDVSVNIGNGEVIGIIGGTGSGKSTLVKLLLDFYPVSGGSRTLGGSNYDDLSPATVRDNMSVCLQKSMIFEGTVAENVKMGNPDATDEQIREVLQIAQMQNFIDGKSEGINYKLTQAGNNLSGGQKQRVNIARTIIKPAAVYIFDDSFSALDYLTESNLRKSLNKYLRGKTQIVVTQRAATAMRCDKVYVLDEGRVVGVGTHEQLLATCSEYREIYSSQMGGGGANE